MSETIDVSIVIPAYNEARRLPPFLEQVISYCSKNPKIYEIIVVDDGSTDGTLAIASSYSSAFPRLSTVRIRRNRGKGYAVKRGLLKSAGAVCVFLDADGSIDPDEIGKNIHYIVNEGYDLFVGSRVLKGASQVLKVRWYRKAAGVVFNYFVHTLLFGDIRDTQCGFKMFRREVVKPLFSRSYLSRFGFDIEILYLSHKMGYRVKEGAVSWRHVGGSKVNLFVDSAEMLINILQVRNWHCTPINPLEKYLGPDEYRFMYELEGMHWWFVGRRKLALRLIEAMRKCSPVILDVGTGTGRNLMAFMKAGRAYGVDVALQAIAFCRKRGLDNVAMSPAERLPFGNKTVDVITCLDLLEHVENPNEVLREFERVLKDDGRIIIMVPAFQILWSQHDEALCHLRRYERESLTVDLDEAGLRPEKMSYFFFTSFFAVAPIRFMRRFFRPGLRSQSDTTSLPPKLLNEFLKILFAAEAWIAVRFGLPFGTTLYAVVSKRKENAEKGLNSQIRADEKRRDGRGY